MYSYSQMSKFSLIFNFHRVILKSILFILIALIVVNELLSWKFTTNRSLSLPTNLISTAVKYRHGDNYLKRPFLDIRSDHVSYVTENRNRALREYTTEDVVRCLDSMAEQRNWRPIHIAFIGDSTIRQHFFSFLQASIFLIALSIIKSWN